MSKNSCFQCAACAAIEFALSVECEEKIQFLRLWNDGAFDILRKEWPETPESVFIGADSLLEAQTE